MKDIEIQMLPSNASTDIEEMEHITNMVNRVYAASEEGIWKSGAVRTTVEEVAELTSGSGIAVAQSKARIVGSVRVRRIDEKTGGLGMLAVDDQYQGNGIGRALIRFAEQECQKNIIARCNWNC